AAPAARIDRQHSHAPSGEASLPRHCDFSGPSSAPPSPPAAQRCRFTPRRYTCSTPVACGARMVARTTGDKRRIRPEGGSRNPPERDSEFARGVATRADRIPHLPMRQRWDARAARLRFTTAAPLQLPTPAAQALSHVDMAGNCPHAVDEVAMRRIALWI